MENIDNTPQELKDRITFLRKKKNLTQAQLAERLAISAQAVSKWESGLSCPDIMMLIPLSKIFEVSTDYLLSGVAEPREVMDSDISEEEEPVKEQYNDTLKEEERHIEEDVWEGEIGSFQN